MAPQRDELIVHLFRRAGFGASDTDLSTFAQLGPLGFTSAVSHLVNYAQQSDDVDSNIGKPGYVGTTSQGVFQPAANITDARQRWLFRMVHSTRPLQEKMTLFWHNHFATAFSKISADTTAQEGARLLAAKPSEDPAGVKGQLELLREHALGNFLGLLTAVAQDPAMLFWLDGRSNVRAHPQENFARELMELFTMGVDTFAEADVYAGARVFTGWNLAQPGTGAAQHYEFSYVSGQHETTAKEFTFPIYPDGTKVIPARSPSNGMQDGLDLLAAVAGHPATGPRLARKLYAFFINEVDAPDQGLIDEVAALYYSRNFEIEPMVRRLLLSSQFSDPSNFYKRYSWPAEFVVRSLKEAGFLGFSVNDSLTPLANMGQQLLEPPDVSGWRLGKAWFSTGTMLARMNFAAQLATNQKFNLRTAYQPDGATADGLLTAVLDRLQPADFDNDGRAALMGYLGSGGAWSGSAAQLLTKVPGLVHLVLGSGEYQLT
jgi:uncharacterized protein (DUF1800 family)